MRCFGFPLFIIVLFIFHSHTNGQFSAAASEPSFLKAKTYFQNEVKENAHLYSGKEYYKYEPGIIGSPFFSNESMQPGDIFYDGNLYINVPMSFDAVRQAVVINKYEQETRMQLLTEKIKYFILNGHRFENISAEGEGNNIIKGLYDVAFTGKASVLVKRVKSIRKGLRAEDPYSFKEEDALYVKKGNIISMVSNKKSVLQVFDDRKDLIKTFIRKKNLKFKKDLEKDLKMTAGYYSTLN